MSGESFVENLLSKLTKSGKYHTYKQVHKNGNILYTLEDKEESGRVLRRSGFYEKRIRLLWKKIRTQDTNT